MSNNKGGVVYGETEFGLGVVVFLGTKALSRGMKKFLKTCKGIISVKLVITSLGLGVSQDDDSEELYYEAGEFFPGGTITKLEKPIDVICSLT